MLKKVYNILAEIFRENLDLKGGEKILDLGCGIRGNFLRYRKVYNTFLTTEISQGKSLESAKPGGSGLASKSQSHNEIGGRNFLKIHPSSYLGIDVNRKIIDSLKKRKDGEYRCMDAKKLIFDDRSFDRVVSISLFHHFSDSDCLLIAGEMRRVLKDEGIMLIADGVYPKSVFNLPGWGVRFFDRGRFVRKENSFKKIFCENFIIKKEYYFISKIFAYSVLIMKKKKKCV